MKELGITQTQLAKLTKASKGAVSQWVNADVVPSSEYLTALAKALRVSANWILHGGTVEEAPAGYVVSKLPLIAWAPAGGWGEPADPYSPGAAEEWISCPFEFGDGSFFIKVVGDSMNPEYQDGEMILVDPTVEARHNDDVVVRSPANSYTFKRLQITPEGIYLLALNPDHPGRKMVFPQDGHVCGVVTGSIINRKRR